MVTIISGTTKKPMASQALIEFFEKNTSFDGHLYIGYPIIGTATGPFPIDATYISREHGLVIFNLVENKIEDDYDEIQDDAANKMESKLRNYRELTIKRRLAIPISVITFYPDREPEKEVDGYPICNEENLESVLKSEDYTWSNNSEYYEKLVSVLQAISTIRKGKKRRNILKSESKGAKLKLLEDSIANLDNRQSKAVIETVDGVQRIRGLAGSGKTIILALKAAYLHAQHEDWKIAVTFNTRSLKRQFKQLINTFYIEQTSEEPNWDNLQIVHAWGSPGGGENDGIYYNFVSSQKDATYLDFAAAKKRFSYEKAFHGACSLALTEQTNSVEQYDAILVDEAQDFSPEFLKICYALLKDPKRLVYAYDELQNLSTESLPSPEVIFGVNSNEIPNVTFEYDSNGNSKQDIILEKCYRNSRPALTTAHALGFGVYREKDFKTDTGLVQMFEQKELWKEVGYDLVDGNLEYGENVDLERSENASPKFLEEHSSIDELIKFQTFSTFEDQNRWIADQIKDNLENDELLYNDIIVINPNPLKTRDAVAPIRKKLFDLSIYSHTVGVDSSRDEFFDVDNESIAFTGIFRAKGNEAAMVYVINAQDCFSGDGSEIAKVRNQLFTAITRSKAWVRIVGVGEDMDRLVNEYGKVKENNFHLRFRYPTEAQLKMLNIINRDMSQGEKLRIKESNTSLQKIISELEQGNLYLEDINPDIVAKLQSLIGSSEKGFDLDE